MSIHEMSVKLSPIFEKFKIKSASVFGSFARGDQQEHSTIDLMISTTEIFDLERFYEFKRLLESELDENIDIVFEDYINPFMKADIISEAVLLYEE